MRKGISAIAAFIALVTLLAVSAQIDGALPILVASVVIFALAERGLELPIGEDKR